MYCGNCGKKLPDGAKFCTGCGQKTIHESKQSPASYSEQNNWQEKENNLKRRNKKKAVPVGVLAALLCIALLAAAGGITAVLITGKKAEVTESTSISVVEKSGENEGESNSLFSGKEEQNDAESTTESETEDNIKLRAVKRYRRNSEDENYELTDDMVCRNMDLPSGYQMYIYMENDNEDDTESQQIVLSSKNDLRKTHTSFRTTDENFSVSHTECDQNNDILFDYFVDLQIDSEYMQLDKYIRNYNTEGETENVTLYRYGYDYWERIPYEQEIEHFNYLITKDEEGNILKQEVFKEGSEEPEEQTEYNYVNGRLIASVYTRGSTVINKQYDARGNVIYENIKYINENYYTEYYTEYLYGTVEDNENFAAKQMMSGVWVFKEKTDEVTNKLGTVDEDTACEMINNMQFLIIDYRTEKCIIFTGENYAVFYWEPDDSGLIHLNDNTLKQGDDVSGDMTVTYDPETDTISITYEDGIKKENLVRW